MHLRHLRIENLRLIEALDLELSPGWNVFTGANGAGKTSLLEAAFLLSHGRSFRGAGRDALSRLGSGGYTVYGELAKRSSSPVHVGIARVGGRTETRLNREPVPIGELMRHTAVLCFEPGSHELIAGPSEGRRRFLDWGVFHVEHSFLAEWRRYQRALRQRNALLRSTSFDPDSMAAWDRELSLAAEPLTRMRRAYFDALQPHLGATSHELLSELGEPRIQFQPGFDADRPLDELLAVQRDRDRARGHTGSGPHRADWSVVFEAAPRREHLSRGQEKLCAFACTMAQARLYADQAGEWPVIGIDDLAAEVDAEHQRRMLDVLATTGAQILVTGTEPSPALSGRDHALTMFHVEQGRVTRLL